MKFQIEVNASEKDIEQLWDEHPNLRALDHAAKLPPYEACIVREMSAAVEFDSIGFVTAATLVLEPRRAVVEAFRDVEEALYNICKEDKP